jgi:hypothetical protein
MLEKTVIKSLLFLVIALSLLATGALARSQYEVLFIWDGAEDFVASDNALKDYLENDLGYYVEYFDDDELEEPTEDAAWDSDMVFISESVTSYSIENEITEVAVPFVTTECWAWPEMGLSYGTGESIDVDNVNIEIVDPNHFLAAGFSGTVPVLRGISGPRGAARFSKGIAGEEATVIARATLPDGVTYDVIYVYEKGAALPVAPTDGSDQIAAGMRVCFGLDEQTYLLWNENAYKLFGAAINYAIGRTGPLQQAWNPDPSDGATDVPRDAVISWRTGLNMKKHDLYFGTDVNSVTEATRDNPMDVLVLQDQDDLRYDPTGLLDYNQTYYWRADEYSDSDPNSPYIGKVWSFTAANFITVEGFETYGDYPPDEIFMVWEDGFFDPMNGSTAGYPNPDFVNGGHYLEDRIVHGGDWSMPIFYDNSAGFSEVTRAFNADWTIDGVVTLSLFYYGDPDNDAEPLYVALDGVVVTNDDSNATRAAEWTQWDIPLQVFADQGVNLSNVGNMSIGLGNKANPIPGGEGHVFIDDIRLYRPDAEAN